MQAKAIAMQRTTDEGKLCGVIGFSCGIPRQRGRGWFMRQPRRFQFGAGGYTRFWNATAQVPYLYSASAKKFITYDDAQSMAVKMNFANQQALGGAMFWEMSEDTESATGTSLLDAVFAGMRLP